MSGFNENLVNMALVPVMGEYGIDSVTAQWLVTAFMIMASIVVVSMAFMYRRFKLRRLFFTATLLTLAGSVIGLAASSFEMLICARVVQAAGSGMFIPMMMNTVMAVVPKKRYGTFLSIGSATITLGPALAPVVCGALVSAFGWHSVFAVPTLAMVLAIAVGAFAVKNLDNYPAHLDKLSLVLAAVLLCTLSYGLSRLTAEPVVAIACLAVSFALGAAFTWRQLHCWNPLIDLTPMRSRAFWPSIVLVTVVFMGCFSCYVLLPLFFEGAAGLDSFHAGLILLVPVMGNAASTLVGGRIMDSRGEWPLLTVGFTCITLGFAAMALFASTLSLSIMFVAALVVYAGTGLIFSPSQTAGLRTLAPDLNAFGVALSTTFIQIAACIGPPLYTGILAGKEAAALAQGVDSGLAMAQGFSAAMIVAACIALFGLMVATVYARYLAHRRAMGA